jgi:hypothetical protein
MKRGNLWISPDTGSVISPTNRIGYLLIVFFARIAEFGDIPRGNNLGFKGRPDAVLNEPAHHLRERVIGQPEISTDGFHPYRMAIRDAFGDSASHGVIVKTYSVTHLVKEAQGRYSPAAVVAVERQVVSGDPDQYVSTSYVERQNLSLRMGSRRFTRLTNGFSKKLDNHVAAVALYVAHYNLCRVHEALKTTPAKALGVVDRAWTIGALIDAALATQPIAPVTTAPERRKGFIVIEGGRK